MPTNVKSDSDKWVRIVDINWREPFQAMVIVLPLI